MTKRSGTPARKVLVIALQLVLLVSSITAIAIGSSFSAKAGATTSVVLGPVSGSFYPLSSDPSNTFPTSGICLPGSTGCTPPPPQQFSGLNFNPTSGTGPSCTPPSGVNEGTTTFTDVVAQPDGSCALQPVTTIPTNPSGIFAAVFSSSIVVPTDNYVATLSVESDDGFILGIGPSNGNQPTSDGANYLGPANSYAYSYPVMGAFNAQEGPTVHSMNVTFPKAGTYPLEIDYTQIGCCLESLVLGGVSVTNSLALTAADTYGGINQSSPCVNCALNAIREGAVRSAGDPVNTSDGDFYQSIPIVSIPGLGPDLSYSITYDSQLAQAQVAGGVTSPGPVGWGWSTSGSMNLAGTSGSGPITVNQEDGAQVVYAPTSTGPGFGGATCTTTGSTQCYTPTESDVTAVLEGLTSSSSFVFSRDDGMTKYTFNSTGHLTSISDANAHTETFAYGVTTGTNCTTSGTACTTETDASGRVLDIVYTTATGLVSKVIDPAGRTWTFSYDANKNLTGVQNPRTYSETFGYDTTSANPTMVHNMTTLTLPNGQTGGPDAGHAYSIVYEESSTATVAPLGYVISQTDPAGLVTGFAYAGNNMTGTGSTTITDPHGVTSVDEYSSGVLMAHIDGANSTHPQTTSYQRNGQGMPTAVSDPNGHTSLATYDTNGNLLTATDASRNIWTYTYNQFNQLLTAIPPSGSAGIETVNTYDANGNLQTTASHPSTGADLTTTYHYVGTPAGLPSSVTDPRGFSTSFTYDTYGDLASSTDPQSDKTTYAYTAIGQLFCSTSPNAAHAGVVCPATPATRVANTTSSSFDTSDTLVATSTDPNGNTSNYTYDPDGNQTTVVDPRSTPTVTAFDADDRPISVTGASGLGVQTVTTTTYDVPPSSTNPNCSNTVAGTAYCVDVIQAQGTLNSETAHYYDAFANEIQTTDSGGEVTANTYDAANNLHTTTTGAGTTTYAYQPNNWLSSEAFSGATAGFSTPSSSTSFTYFGDGVRKTMVDATGTTTYSYGTYGRLTSVVNGNGAKVTYGYNNDNDVTCLSYPNSGTQNCGNATSGTGIIADTYDTADRLSSLTDWNAKAINFGYDYDSNWKSTTYPTTTATSVAETFGNADNQTNETVTNANLSGGSQSTTWTPNPDELFATDKINSGTANAYTYNALNYVIGLAGSNSYSYDKLGRVTSDTPNGGSATNFGYTADSALCWTGTGSGSCASPPTGATRYGSNAIDARCYSTTSTTSGTCIAPPSGSTTQSYGYNQLGQLTCATAPNSSSYTCASPNASKTTTYAYNGDGLRTSDTPAGGSTQQFTWDISTSVPELLTDGTNSYLYGPNGTPVEQLVTSSATASYLVSDPTGLRYQFSASGSVAGSKAYNPYGTCSSCTGSTPFGFEDGYTDANGLIYLVNRYYDPATDQFIAVDPLVYQTGQAFAYAGDDPANGSDPNGLMKLVRGGQICASSGVSTQCINSSTSPSACYSIDSRAGGDPLTDGTCKSPGGSTGDFCLSGDVLIGYGLTGSICIVIGNGQIGVTESGGYGSGFGAGLSATLGVSNVCQVKDLNGPFLDNGLSLGPLAASESSGKSTDGPIQTVNAGFTAGLKAGVHFGRTYTSSQASGSNGSCCR